MKLKNLKFPKRRRRKKNVENNETVGYKCLLLGPNIAAKDSFLDDLNMMEGKPTLGHNEGVMKIDNSECVFWKVDPSCEKDKSCIKQYLDFHNPDMIFYFIDIGGDDQTKVELMIHQLVALMKVVQEEQNCCIVFDKEYIDNIEDLNMDQELFKEKRMKMVNFKIEFCFSGIDEMSQILDNLTTSAAVTAIPTEGEPEWEATEDDPIWDEFCDIGGYEEYFLSPLPVLKENLVENYGLKEDFLVDFPEKEDNGSWLGEAGQNVVESF
jgi:hypothetical protein